MNNHLRVEQVQVPEELNCRSCHSSVIFGNVIYYFAGHFKELDQQTNIITKFYPERRIWIDLYPTKDKPCPRPRCSHTSNVYKNKMYVFGGGGGTTRATEYYLNDFWNFNFITEEWEEIKQTNPPKVRDSHVSAIWKDSLIIHGGHCEHSMFKDLHIFNFKKNQWKEVYFDEFLPSPGGRTRHGAVLHNDNFFVFGGYRHGVLLNDLFCCDLNLMEWKRIELKNNPSPRRSHMVTSDKNFMYSVGGFDGIDTFDSIHRLNLDELKSWEEIESNHQKLPKRGVGTISLYKNEIYCFGGNLESDYYNDVFLIELNQNEFQMKLKHCQFYHDLEIQLIV
eukprot:gene8204-32_t